LSTDAVYALGVGLKFAGGASADGSVVADGGANTVAWVFDADSSSRTKIKVYLDMHKLNKIFVAPSA